MAAPIYDEGLKWMTLVDIRLELSLPQGILG